MMIIGGLASGPQIAPTVPPEKYGQAAIAFIVCLLPDLCIHKWLTWTCSASTSSLLMYLGGHSLGPLLLRCVSARIGPKSWALVQRPSGVRRFQSLIFPI